MKKLAILLILVVAIFGCGKESEQIDADTIQAKDEAQTLTIAWHKVIEDDGSICHLSASTQQSVEQASEELRKALATKGVEIVVETLTPEKVEGGDCMCNRVLIQGRFVDDWLGADLVKTSCSGCPSRAGCPKGSGSGGSGQCGGQTAMVHQGRTYEIIPTSLIAMAGVVAAADLTGETITYGGTSGHGVCKGDCTCGHGEGACTCHGADASAAGYSEDCPGHCTCEGDCTCGHGDGRCSCHGGDVSAAKCGPDCPGRTATCGMVCRDNPGTCSGHCTKTAAAGSKTGGCPHATQCAGKTCAVSGH